MYSFEINNRGHVWRKDGDSVDIFGFEYGNCNGPVCVNCGYSFCHHCTPEPQEDCPYKNQLEFIF